MRILCVITSILIVIFVTGCSKQEFPVAGSNNQDTNMTEEVDSKLSSEKLVVETNFCNRQNRNIFCFENIIFVGNKGYRYEDGKYSLSAEKLTDYFPEEDREQLSGLLENNVEGTILQSNNILIYEVKQAPGEYRITFVDFPTGEIKGSYILPAHMECVFEEKLYYMAERENAEGAKYYTLEYLDCNNLTSHVLYTSDKAFGQMMVRGDGAVAFATYEDGYYLIDAGGNIRLLHKAIEERYNYAKEIFELFDDTGLYFRIEYYNHAMELIKLSEDGSMYRIKSDALYNEQAVNGGMLIYEGNVAKLYPYQYETLEVDRLQFREEIVRDSPLNEYQIIDSLYQEEGYQLMDYVYQNDIVWWIWEKDDTMIITKTVVD